MATPKLCKKHFHEVANYFDKDVALAYEIDGDGCVVCTRVTFVEMARRFVEQPAVSEGNRYNGNDAGSTPKRGDKYARLSGI